jgi:GNAT superfamily N-acetyltransferase
MQTLTYQLEPGLTPDEFIDVLVSSTLAERRPVHNLDAIRSMLHNADVIGTARLDGLLVGVSRAITDFAFCTYLSDLAVDERQQRQGIGRELIRRTHEAAGLHTMLVLLSAPRAQTYYPHIGMTHTLFNSIPANEYAHIENRGRLFALQRLAWETRPFSSLFFSPFFSNHGQHSSSGQNPMRLTWGCLSSIV